MTAVPQECVEHQLLQEIRVYLERPGARVANRDAPLYLESLIHRIDTVLAGKEPFDLAEARKEI